MFASLATKGAPVSFGSFQNRSTRTVPYDNNLSFNRIIHKVDTKPEDTIYSIDTVPILKAIDADKLEDLTKITLGCKPVRDGVGIWDVLFNTAQRLSLSGCILTADKDFKPLGRDRIVVTSNFMDLNKATTRAHLSRVIEGDRVGVGLYDMTTSKVYVLLYEISGFCHIQDMSVGRDDRPGLTPAANLLMTNMLIIDADGQAEVLDMDEDSPYPQDKAHPFVEHIAESVYNVSTGYSWKPHFLPFQPTGFNRADLEARLAEELGEAREVSYQELDELCRAAHLEKAIIHRANRVPRDVQPVQTKARKRPGALPRPPVDLPVVEVVKMTDWYLFHIDHTKESEDEVVKVAADQLGKAQIVETYLTGQDLAGTLISENSTVLTLPVEPFGENAYLRYFTLNF